MAKSLKVGDRVKVIAGDLKGTVASIVKVDKKAESDAERSQHQNSPHAQDAV